MAKPRLNDKFPISKSLSPPILDKPIPECAEAVHVSGFIPHATVRVYANNTELLAEESPPFGFTDVTLNRPLVLNEAITATQTVSGTTSDHSVHPVIVSSTLETAVRTTKPVVGSNLFQCGRVVPVDNLVVGTRVHVSEDRSEVGNEAVAVSKTNVLTSKLHAGAKVTAQQISCERTNHPTKGPAADPVLVKPAPSPIPAPAVDASTLVVGNDTVTLSRLLVGAAVEIFSDSTKISSGWLATGERTWFPVNPPISSANITATQELCDKVSEPSKPEVPIAGLKPPIVLAPVCNGSSYAIVRNSIVNAIVVILKNGTPVGQGGSGPGDVIIACAGGQVLNAGDQVTAVQYMGPEVSPESAVVTVSGTLPAPVVETFGGEPFFLPKGNDMPLDGPVFPRGRGPGPVIHVQACCRENVWVRIFDPSGKLVAEPPVVEGIPGYWTTSWDWTSFSGWEVPNGIPVGRYTIEAHSKCSERNATVPFYVIFNPEDVRGPPRFSFDDITVWFYANDDQVVGLHYYLRQSDMRVFSRAIDAIHGKTDSYDAAIAISRAEEALFDYSLNYHSNDVLDMILNFSEAQCADDASILTSLLRCAGIPAHNVSADAALETGAANWTFDTWVEFLASHGGSTEWRVLHPHEYPGMTPESRSTFGTSRGVATKDFNDLIVMANETWVSADLDDGLVDVSFTRNSCREPDQRILKASWIDELCEGGYWPAPHWDCTGVRSRSLRSVQGFQFSKSEVFFDDRVSGTVDVVNMSTDRIATELTAELIVTIPESKAFPNASLDKTTSVSLGLNGGESSLVSFDLKIPRSLDPGNLLYLWLHAGLNKETIALQQLPLSPGMTCEVSAPRHVQVGVAHIITATLSNSSNNNPLTNVAVELRTPFAAEIQDHPRHELQTLEPGQKRQVSWTVKGITALRSGSNTIQVSSGNAGGLKIHRPIRILGGEEQEEPFVKPLPALKPLG